MAAFVFPSSRKVILSGPLYAKIVLMFKKIFSNILVICLSLTLLCGCSSTDKDKPFDALTFVDECRILYPKKAYSGKEDKEVEMDFTLIVFEKFGKTDYYKNMTDDEREQAIKDICEVFKTYSYGDISNGFIRKYSFDSKKHSLTWTVMASSDTTMEWALPGY